MFALLAILPVLSVAILLVGLRWPASKAMPVCYIVALQAVGGAAGNMICVHNVVAASAVAGLFGKEGDILRKTFWPFFYYALLTGVVGLIVFGMAR